MRMRPNNQAGFSLMELMVGMVLGLIVVSGAVAIYLASARSYSEVEQSGQLSENSRFAEQVLTDALRHAGFMGEASAGKITVDAGALGAITGDCNTGTEAGAYFIMTPIYAVTATSDNSTPDIGCFGDTPDTNALAGTEILILKSAIPLPVSDGPRDADLSLPAASPTHRNNILDYPAGVDFTGKLWLLTNNVIGRMFDGDNTIPSIVTGGDVPRGSAWQYRYEVYFIRDVRRADGKQLPVLSRYVLAEESAGGAMELRREDLVPGVEDMRMRFGLDTQGNDGEVDVYSTVAEVQASGDWDQITSIEIAMLVSSQDEDPNYTDANSYTLAGAPANVPATRLQHRRTVVRSNVSLRNIKFVIRGSIE